MSVAHGGVPLHPMSGYAEEDIQDSPLSASTPDDTDDPFELTFEHAAVGLAHLGADGRWLRANPALCELLGYEEQELLQRTFRDVTHPDDLEESVQLQQRLLDQGQSQLCLEKRYVRRDGQERWVNVRLSPMRHPEAAVIAVIVDIDERKQLEGRLSRRRAELEEANANLQSFGYSVSHDLRAPLRAILGFARILAEDYGQRLDAEGKRLLSVVERNASRMGKLIDSLLAFSRLGRRALHCVPTDMSLLAREAYEGRQPELSADRHVDLTVHPLPMAVVDPVMMRQVWDNLIGNALKYTRLRPHTIIEVGGELRRKEARFFVRDNGVGFDPGHGSNLFEVFSRLHSEHDFEGEGVGLAIVQNIVKRHGGRVWAEAEPDVGATFWFSLPRDSICALRASKEKPARPFTLKS